MKAALIILATLFSVPAVATASPPTSPAPTDRVERPRPASDAELERYAEREKQAQELEEFEGGRRGTIATSTVIIILLVAILVVLII